MFIRSVRLENFVPYYGQVSVVFPVHENRNVYLIVGDNGYGKTSFLNAIKWALYGGTGIRTNDRSINSAAVAEGHAQMSVGIVFEENGITYQLTREYRSGSAETLELGTRDNQWSSEVAQQKIGEMLPRHTADFFIFEGELVRELAQTQRHERVREHIETLLGLKAIRNAVADLHTVDGDVVKRLDGLQSRNRDFQKVKDACSGLREQIAALDNSLSVRNRELASLQEAVAYYESELAQADQLKPLVERKRNLEEHIEGLKDRRRELRDTRKELMENIYLLFLLDQLSESKGQIEHQLERALHAERHVHDTAAKQRLIEKSIHEQRCALCGNSPIDEVRLREECIHLQNLCNDHTPGQSSSETERQLRLVDDALRSAVQDVAKPLVRVLKDIELVQEQINNAEIECDRISEELGGFDHELYREFAQHRTEALRRMGGLEYEIGSLLDQRGTLQDELTEKSRKMKQFGSIEEQTRRCVQQHLLIEQCEDGFEEILEKSVAMNRERILTASNHFFRKLTNKPDEYDRFKFATDEAYAFQLIRNDGQEPDMDMISDGEKEIVAMSFVLGLSRHSRIMAPLIMDNVNSRLDGRHRCNLGAVWMGLDNQVILLGIDKDFDRETRQIMKDAICKEYELTREDDRFSRLRVRNG